MNPKHNYAVLPRQAPRGALCAAAGSQQQPGAAAGCSSRHAVGALQQPAAHDTLHALQQPAAHGALLLCSSRLNSSLCAQRSTSRARMTGSGWLSARACALLKYHASSEEAAGGGCNFERDSGGEETLALATYTARGWPQRPQHTCTGKHAAHVLKNSRRTCRFVI